MVYTDEGRLVKGTPLYRGGVAIGQISDSYVDPDGQLGVRARTYTDTVEGIQACAGIKDGTLNGFNVRKNP